MRLPGIGNNGRLLWISTEISGYIEDGGFHHFVTIGFHRISHMFPQAGASSAVIAQDNKKLCVK